MRRTMCLGRRRTSSATRVRFRPIKDTVNRIAPPSRSTVSMTDVHPGLGRSKTAHRSNSVNPDTTASNTTANPPRLLASKSRPDDCEHVSLLDFGCGYGALLDHPSITAHRVIYAGIDVSTDMVAAAERLHQTCGVEHRGYAFEASDDIRDRYDIIVASGIFNVKLDISEELWKQYVWDTIRLIANRSTEAFAYNCLTSRTDPGKRREDLHYADQLEHTAFVEELGFDAEVAEDYGLFEFTIYGRR